MYEVYKFWEAFLKRITIPWGIKAYASSNEHEMVDVILEWRVPNRDDPQVLIDIIRSFNPVNMLDESYALSTLKHNLQKLVLHEFDEQFRLDGQLVFDPHERAA